MATLFTKLRNMRLQNVGYMSRYIVKKVCEPFPPIRNYLRKIYGPMMSGANKEDTVIILINPNSYGFACKFARQGVKKVICVFTDEKCFIQLPKRKRNHPNLNLITDRLLYAESPLEMMYTNRHHLFDEMDFRDVTVKILLKDAAKRSLWKCHMFDINILGTNPQLTNFEWYGLMPENYFEKMHKKDVISVPPIRELSLVTQIVSCYTGKKTTMDFVKSVPNLEFFKHLPTKEDQLDFLKFSRVFRKFNGGKRITPELQLFPGCVSYLSNDGFYINTLKKDIVESDLIRIFKIIKRLPGFKESVLKSVMENMDGSQTNRYKLWRR